MTSTPSSSSNGARAGGLRRTLLAATAGMSVLVAVIAGVALGGYVWAAGEIDTLGEAQLTLTPEEGGGATEDREIAGHCDERSCNYLLLGSDDREGLTREEEIAFGTNADLGGEQRSDTIILVHTEPDKDRAVILSFPRDLWVEVPGRGMDKINAAFEGGIKGAGPARIARTIRDLTGLQVHHVMYVNLSGFQDVVDAIDGVDLCVPRDLYDPLAGLDLKAGCHRLDGAQSLAYVRTRNVGDCVPDFGRIQRQQQFFRAVLAGLLSPGQILRLPGLVQAAAKNVVLSPGLTPADLAYLAQQLEGISTGAADFRSVPGTPELIRPPEFPGGISVVTLNPEARDMFAALREGRPLGNIGKELQGVQISPANVPMAVYDKASEGRAQEALDVLAQGGFDVDPLPRPIAELEADSKGSVLLVEKGEEAKGDVVVQYLSNLKTDVVPNGALGELDAAVVVTSGYEPEPVGSEEGQATPECA